MSEIIEIAKENGFFNDAIDVVDYYCEKDENGKVCYRRSDRSGRDFYDLVPLGYITDDERERLFDSITDDLQLDDYNWGTFDTDSVYEELEYNLIDEIIGTLTESVRGKAMKRNFKKLQENKKLNENVSSYMTVEELLNDLATAFEHLVDGFEGDNADEIDLNGLDANEYYPFNKDLYEVFNDVCNWANEVEEEISKTKTESRKSRKVSKKLTETWEGEDVVDDIIDRAKMNIDDGDDLEDAVAYALDSGLIYTADVRKLAIHYDTMPDDSELINGFYEMLYGDVYNAASDYYDEVHAEDDEEVEESLKRVKSLIERRGSKFVYDEDELNAEMPDIKRLYKKIGIELAETPFKLISKQYPEFAKWFARYHENMESNDNGVLDDNSTPIDEYWEFMDDVDFRALFDFIDDRGAQSAAKQYGKYSANTSDILGIDDETEVFIKPDGTFEQPGFRR